MKRKLVRQGAATMMVSLPAKWIKENNLKKGDEVDIISDESDLVVSAKAKDVVSRVEFVASDLFPLHRRLVSNNYIKGFDEITITSKKPELLIHIPSDVKSHLIGFEVVEQTKDSIKLKQVSHVAEEEFDVMLRRTFLLIKLMGQDIFSALKNKESFDHIFAQEENINRFTNFCLRTIIKSNKPAPLYTIVFLLENIGDSYKELLNHNPSPVLLRFLDEINVFFADYINVFYNLDKAPVFGKNFQSLSAKLNRVKVSSSDHALFLANLRQILNFIILLLNNQLNL